MADPTEQTPVVKGDPIAGVKKAVSFLAIAVALLALAVWMMAIAKMGLAINSLGAFLPLVVGVLAVAALLHARRKDAD